MGIRNSLVAALNERADELNAAAERRERIYVAMAIVTLLIAIGLTWAVSRSITRPLRVAHPPGQGHGRPPVARRRDRHPRDAARRGRHRAAGRPGRASSTRDEVSDVADALNTVQDTALDLAVEQAVLRRNIADSFVNLGRRNQNLLGRQLDFITELETNETDADTLSNLFRLDHLATRMRRNAESLLVLAGIEPPRQWAAPVRLTDVIRAALGEVENYQRVDGARRRARHHHRLRRRRPRPPPRRAHRERPRLLAARPDASTSGAATTTDGGYTLAVIDTGLGMAAKDVTSANRRLAGAESFTVAPSKYLGHYVAGNLAARHDIHVRLDTSPGQGITATVALPAEPAHDRTGHECAGHPAARSPRGPRRDGAASRGPAAGARAALASVRHPCGRRPVGPSSHRPLGARGRRPRRRRSRRCRPLRWRCPPPRARRPLRPRTYHRSAGGPCRSAAAGAGRARATAPVRRRPPGLPHGRPVAPPADAPGRPADRGRAPAHRIGRHRRAPPHGRRARPPRPRRPAAARHPGGRRDPAPGVRRYAPTPRHAGARDHGRHRPLLPSSAAPRP